MSLSIFLFNGGKKKFIIVYFFILTIAIKISKGHLRERICFLFVCNTRLILSGLIMVEHIATMMKLQKIVRDGKIMDKRRTLKWSYIMELKLNYQHVSLRIFACLFFCLHW
jgi:hypothetical protein